MTTPELTSSQIAQELHTVFDGQIMNYGAYNLVFASGSAMYPNPDVSSLQEEGQEYFLVGYRDTPLEAVVTPLALPEVRSTGTPTSIDNTNAMQVFTADEFRFVLQATNGTAFNLTFEPKMRVVLDAGEGVLDQELDIEDFRRVIIEAWEM